MLVPAVLFLCVFSCVPAEIPPSQLHLGPFVAAPEERASFLQEVASRGDAALIGFVHQHNPGAWTSPGADTTPLHAAAERGNALAVRALLALGLSARARDSSGRTPLHITAKDDTSLLCTIELLDAGAEVDAVSGDGFTALMVAIREGAPGTVGALLEAGADRSKIVGGYQFSAVTYALKHLGVFTIAQILGVIPVASFEYRHYQCVSSRKTENDYSGLFLSVNSTDSMLRTYLHKQCFTERSTINSTASASGVNERDLFRRTPLHVAALWGNAACARGLLQLGADVRAVDWLGRTPLHVAALCRHSDVQTLLEEAGADYAATDLRGRTPLDLQAILH